MTSFIYTNLYAIVAIVNIPLAIAVIFMERRNVVVTWAWLMVLLFLPVIGFGVYLIVGQNLSKKKLYKINKLTLSTLNALIDDQRKAFREHKIIYHDPVMENYQELIYMNLSSNSALYSQNNAIHIYTNGNDKFESLMRDIEGATKHIHLMYYIVQPDGLGNRLVDILTKKATQGVKVRFLYDDIGSSHLPRHFFDRLKHAGGEVAAFFPSKIPYLNFRVNYRNHRKLAIIDGIVGYIGGINIGDEYLGLNKRYGYWRDSHLRIQGYAVQQMQGHFMMDWNLASSSKIHKDMEDLFYEANDFGSAGIQIVSSGPDQTMEQIKNAYIKMILSAKESIYIQTPYFIPDDSMLNALKMAALSGVDVRIMLPSKPDHQMVFWASLSYLGELLAEGITCYQYDKGFLHAKMIVVDGKIASIGTANFDIRSFKLNFEINAIIYDSETAQMLKQIFENDINDSLELTYDAYKARPLLQQVKESCTRLLSPIL